MPDAEHIKWKKEILEWEQHLRWQGKTFSIITAAAGIFNLGVMLLIVFVVLPSIYMLSSEAHKALLIAESNTQSLSQSKELIGRNQQEIDRINHSAAEAISLIKKLVKEKEASAKDP